MPSPISKPTEAAGIVGEYFWKLFLQQPSSGEAAELRQTVELKEKIHFGAVAIIEDSPQP